MRSRISERMTDPATCIRFLRAGRLVRVARKDADFGWGVVLSVLRARKAGAGAAEGVGDRMEYLVDVLLECAVEELGGGPRPPAAGEPSVMRAVPVRLPLLASISKARTSRGLFGAALARLFYFCYRPCVACVPCSSARTLYCVPCIMRIVPSTLFPSPLLSHLLPIDPSLFLSLGSDCSGCAPCSSASLSPKTSSRTRRSSR